uniref:Uncharacterized protein n=1 Tax=Mesocestoides corti TaxID=53468 RepID=A0A5K3FWX0_MESCO
MWGAGMCRTGYFTNTGYQQHCGEPSQKLRTASLQRGRQCDAGVVLRQIRAQTCWTTWPQPILCPSSFQWRARKISSQPEKDTTEEQYIMNGVANSDGRRLTCGSGF